MAILFTQNIPPLQSIPYTSKPSWCSLSSRVVNSLSFHILQDWHNGPNLSSVKLQLNYIIYEFGLVLKKKINHYFNPSSFLKAEKK